MVEPINPQSVQMTAPAHVGFKMVKIRTLMSISLKKPDGSSDIVGPNEIIEVTEEQAKEFADKVIGGGYNMSGEHQEAFAESTRHRYKRAERL